MRRWIIGAISVLGGIFLLAQVTFAAVYPAPTGYVNDFARVLSQEVENSLEQQLSSFTASTSNELAVVTLTSLEGEIIENAAVKFFEEWGIGDKEKDNGVLLLVAVNDRELRIEVGYGLEPVLTDSRAGNIIRTEITPHFKNGDYEGGIIAGTEAIIEVVTGDAAAFDEASPDNSTEGDAAQLGIFAVVGLFMYIAAFLSRSNRFWPGGLAGFIFGLFVGGVFAIFGLALLGLFLDFILSKNYKVRKTKGLPTSWWSSTGGFSSGGSSSGSSGGFSGGSSGGGGSSGSW